jgi:signal transduction histidine kinase
LGDAGARVPRPTCVVWALRRERDLSDAPSSRIPVLNTGARILIAQEVEIRIRDNGSGIPPEVQEKMFNPFFTTKPAATTSS